MKEREIFSKENLLFVLLGGFFVTNALVAEFIGVKIFSLELSLGFDSMDWSIFGVNGLGFNLTAGVLLWPVVFVMTDIINEYYGERGVKILSFMTVGLILFAFAITFLAIQLTPAEFWPQSHVKQNLTDEERSLILSQVGNYNEAYRLVFGQGLWIIFASVIAFLIGQVVDVTVFHRIKQWTGERKVWLRATGSTLISQFIDSFVVLFIAFYIGANWPIVMVLAIGIVNYIYKFSMAILLTPVIYAAHFLIDRYLGKEKAEQLKLAAMQ